MLYRIKNITGDTTNPDSRLWEGKTLYATSDRYQAVLPIGPQETATVGEHAYAELSAYFPLYVSVLDPAGEADFSMPYRLKITFSSTGAWIPVDLGRFAGRLVITNPDDANTAQFSFSGFIDPATAPPAIMQSDVLPLESVTIDTPMSPLRYLYAAGTSGSFLYILVG